MQNEAHHKRSGKSRQSLRLYEDTPGEALELVGGTSPSSRGSRLLSTLLNLPVLPIITLYLRSIESRQTLAAGRLLEIRSLRFRAATREVVVELSFSGTSAARKLIIPLAMINEVTVHLGGETGGPVPMDLRIGYRDDHGSQRFLECDLFVEAMDLRSEGMDLVFRLARVLGFGGYFIREDTSELLTVELARETRAASMTSPYRGVVRFEGLRDVPHLGEPADYSVLSAETVEPPDAPAAPSAKPAESVKRPLPEGFLEWEPGQRVHLRVERVPPQDQRKGKMQLERLLGTGVYLVILYLLFGIVLVPMSESGLRALDAGGFLPRGFARFWWLAFATPFIPILGIWALGRGSGRSVRDPGGWSRFIRRDTVFDWRSGLVSFQGLLRKKTFPLADIREVRITNCRAPDLGSPVALEILVGARYHRTVWVADLDTKADLDTQAKTTSRQIALAEELARALNVPLTRVMKPGPVTTEKEDFTTGERVAVEWGKQWWDAEVVKAVGPRKWRIHYVGWASSWDEDVGPDRIRPAGAVSITGGKGCWTPSCTTSLVVIAIFAGLLGIVSRCLNEPLDTSRPPVTDTTPLSAGDPVHAEWRSTWYEAEVVSPLPDGTVRIHYVGYSSDSDEVVPRSRLRLPPERRRPPP